MSVPSSESARTPTAIEHPFPQVPYYSIEYPGYVQHSSVPLAIENLGGQSKLGHAFRRSSHKTDALLELSFHRDNPFTHPIPGDVVPANSLLLKVVKRKRKAPIDAMSIDNSDSIIGEFTAEVVGIVSKTARFRSALI